MEANSANALRLAAALGQGLILIPDFLAKNDIKSGKLVPVLTEFCAAEQPINAVYPHRQHLATNVRGFLDLVTQHFDATNERPAPEALDVPPALIAARGARPAARFNVLS